MSAINPATLDALAAIRERDKAMWRPGDCLQLRQDIHLLLEHMDVVLAIAASRLGNGGKSASN